MTSYNVEVYQANYTSGTYTKLAEISTWKSFEFNKVDNKIKRGRLSLTTLDKATRYIIPYQNWILIKRNGVPEFFGNIIDVNGNLEGVKGEIKVELADVLYRLTRIYSDLQFVNTNTDAGTIVSNIVSEIQSRSNANFGINDNIIETIGNSNQTLFNQSLGGAIIDQSDNIRSYYCEFLPTLDSDGKLNDIKLNVFKSRGVDRTKSLEPISIGLQTNKVEFGMDTEMFNKIYVQGQGTGQEVPLETAEDNNVQSTFGRIETVEKRPNIAVRSTLENTANELLNQNKAIRLELGFDLNPSYKPYYGDFGLYDTIPLDINIENTFFNFNGSARVEELEFSVSDTEETIRPIVTYYKKNT